jgi:hypothetical protein
LLSDEEAGGNLEGSGGASLDVEAILEGYGEKVRPARCLVGGQPAGVWRAGELSK